MNFAQAQAYISDLINESASRREPYRLDRMRSFLRALGDPQNMYPTIHVGGTSGKGSTCTMLASVLTASGKRTGLHTKPHMRSMTERARIDGQPIAEERFAELVERMISAMDRVAAEFTKPSYYEALLALAFLYFAEVRVDVAVVEVGIGGKLDGTNVLTPLVSVITNIGLDHTEILGETLEAIAADKVGIAKPGVPLLSAVEDSGARAAIEARCAQVGAPFIYVPDRIAISDIESEPFSQRLTLTTDDAKYKVVLPVLGAFQQQNAACAVLALEQLPETLRPSTVTVERGLSRLDLPGRMEYFPSHPGVVFDVAHNPDKAAHLTAALAERFAGKRFTFVTAVGESKDAPAMLRVFAQLPSSFIFTSFEARGRVAIKPQRLASLAEGEGLWGRAIADPIEAFTVARRNAGGEDIVVVTGSTFVVAELREWWMENVLATESSR